MALSNSTGLGSEVGEEPAEGWAWLSRLGRGRDSLEEEDSAPAKAEDEETLSGDAMDSLGTGPPSAADDEERTITGVPVTALL